ncbi:MAG: ASPIC/UnbV domain-containing protein, partial [Planctomycetes bacterium]|nr:ASPIC/UnbV domain-containing protein [Planctomycetota bacterium]
FREVGGRFGDAFAKPRDVRSAAAEDFDGDGRIDVALAANGAPPIVLSSRLESRRWIRLELQPQAAGDDPASRGRSRDPASAGDPADPVDPRHPAGAGDPPDPRSPGGREDATKAADRADAADPRDPGHEASPPPSAPRRERGVVELIAGGRRQIRWFASDGTCLATGRPEMHIGLGEAASVDRIQVRWPSGSVQTWTGVAADACYLVRESEERLLER